MKKSIFSAAILAIGLVLAAVCFGYFYKEARVVVTDQIKNISVKGYAEKNISSDKAIWTGTLVTQGNSLQEAYRQLEQQRNKSKNFWQKKICLKKKSASPLSIPSPNKS